ERRQDRGGIEDLPVAAEGVAGWAVGGGGERLERDRRLGLEARVLTEAKQRGDGIEEPSGARRDDAVGSRLELAPQHEELARTRGANRLEVLVKVEPRGIEMRERGAVGVADHAVTTGQANLAKVPET